MKTEFLFATVVIRITVVGLFLISPFLFVGKVAAQQCADPPCEKPVSEREPSSRPRNPSTARTRRPVTAPRKRASAGSNNNAAKQALERGDIYFSLHHYPEAVSAYEDAIRLKPKYAEAYSNLSYTYYRQRKLDDAEKAANRALELNPGLATAITRLGHVYGDRRKVSEAKAQYEKALNINPNLAEAHNGLGTVYRSLRQRVEAIAAYQRAIDLSPKWAIPHSNLALVYSDLNRYNDAITEYQRASKLDPTWALPHNNLGVVYARLKRYNEAIAEYQAAITLADAWALPHNNLGNTYRDLKRYSDAIGEYQRAITLDPTWATPHDNVGNVYYFDRYGSNAAAIDEYREAIRKSPNWALPRFHLGTVYRQDGRHSEALTEFQKYIDLASKFRNQIGIEMIWVPPGTFMMGSTDGEVEAAYKTAKDYLGESAKLESFTREKPRHPLVIREGFYMGRYEVTQGQWQALMGTTVQQQRDKVNPSWAMRGEGDKYPMCYVSWDEAQQFIAKLNQMNDGYTYSLPTEAEWEYACRAATTTAFEFGDSLNSAQANFDGNYPYGGAEKGINRQMTTPVGSFQPNAAGLYDMHGNVSEWCQDWYHDSYNTAPNDGSAWLSGGDQKYRVLRGGSWKYSGYQLRSAYRDGNSPSGRLGIVGFRVVAVRRTQ